MTCPYCQGPWPCSDPRCIEAAPCPGCGHPTSLEPLPGGAALVYCYHCGREDRFPPGLPVLHSEPEPPEEVNDTLPF